MGKKIFNVVFPAHLCEGVCECGGNQAQDNEDLHGFVWFEGGKLKNFRMVGFGGGKLRLFHLCRKTENISQQ
jgi:hypothetical protein